LTTILSAQPAFVLPPSLGGVNPPTVPPFRDRGRIRRAINSKLVSATMRRRLPFHVVVPTRCLGCEGCVSPLAHLDLTVVMVIDGTCSHWCVGDRNYSLWKANGWDAHYIRGVPSPRGTLSHLLPSLSASPARSWPVVHSYFCPTLLVFGGGFHLDLRSSPCHFLWPVSPPSWHEGIWVERVL
jgi:hypothetical protein